MEKFQRVAAPAVALAANDIDTDQIIPARFLKIPRDAGLGGCLFHDQRFAADGTPIPGFVLNDSAHAAAKILIAAENFGCGSSRESAVYAIYDYGFRAVIATSFGDIFHQNSLKNGLLPIRLPAETTARLRELVQQNPAGLLDIDLESQGIACFDGTRIGFDIDPFWKEALLKGVDELGLTLTYRDEIAQFEARYHAEMAWLA